MSKIKKDTKIDLATDVEKCINIMKKLDKTLLEFKNAYSKLEEEGRKDELMLVGGVVVAAISPIGGIGFYSRIGHQLYCNGAMKLLNEDDKPNPFPFLEEILNK